MSKDRSALRVAVIAGDGIGQEVTAEAVRVLQAALVDSDRDLVLADFDLGANRYLADGHILDEDDLAQLAEFDSILLGAVGDPRVTPGVLERGLLLKLRFAFDHYVNLRPSKHYPGVASPLRDPEGIDFVVVRELIGGAYFGAHTTELVNGEETASDLMAYSEHEVERIARVAFDLAGKRGRRESISIRCLHPAPAAPPRALGPAPARLRGPRPHHPVRAAPAEAHDLR